MKRIHVVAAVIVRAEQILIALRPDHVHQGGKWEFPGGKVELGEAVQDALERELKEELGVEVGTAEPLITIAHDYPDKQVLLDVWKVTSFRGDPTGMEGQEVRWVTANELQEYTFPDANVPIVAAARLPRHYVITPEMDDDPERFMGALQQCLQQGYRLFQLRCKQWNADWDSWIEPMLELTRLHNGLMLANSDMPGHIQQRLGGVHLTSQKLMSIRGRPPYCQWVAASCHSEEELRQAEALGLDFVTLSPFNHTQSHPDAAPIPREQFKEWLQRSKVPVFALGGVAPADLCGIAALGAQGVAGISGFWPSSD